jgi:hypothetical protein
MHIKTAHSLNALTIEACEEVIESLSLASCVPPSFILCYYTESHCASQIAKKLQFAFGSVVILGCSSCQGLMTEKGYHSNNLVGLGVWAIWDDSGSYGTAIEYYDNQDILPELAAQHALEKALVQAGREGELPELIWLHAAPGFEERVIHGLQQVLGDRVPIAGGSSADNLATGHWSMFAGHQVETQGIALAVLFPGGEIGYSFHSGYVESRALGTVTASISRTIISIDNQPAADVYCKAAGIHYQPNCQHQTIIESSTLQPLGREVGLFDSVPIFKLSHPLGVTSEGGLSLFSDIQQGDYLYLMEGTRESLISRAARVTKASLEYRTRQSEPIGALVIYCAGCMLAVKDEMSTVVDNVCRSLGDAPFIGAFTYGEQGHFVSGGSGHGNLMISSVVFYQD